MEITCSDNNRLQIIQPDLAHKAQAVIFSVIGGVGSLAVLISHEGLENGIIFYIFLIMGFIWFRFGGKPDMATFDRKKNTLELVEYKGTFSKPVTRDVKLSEIISCNLGGTHFINPAFEGSNRKTFAIIVTMSKGDKISILPYTNGKKRCESLFRKVLEFLGKPGT